MAVRTEGTPCWVEAQLPDLEAGKRFYGGLFGWTFVPGRTEALLGGRPVAGLLPKRDGRMPTTWTLYLATPDAGTLAARIKAAGGQMIMEPYPVGPFGVLALAADPGGAVFGLRQEGDEDGFGVTGAPGSFRWMEVHTRRPDAVDTFYASVFGYLGRQADAREEGRDPGFDYRVWSPPGSRPGDGGAFGGRAVLTDDFPAEMPGHVLVHFAVPDCDAACATAVRLGGRVAVEPLDTPHGRVAVLHDDQGARFGVLAPPPAPAGPPAEPRRPAETGGSLTESGRTPTESEGRPTEPGEPGETGEDQESGGPPPSGPAAGPRPSGTS